MIARKRCLPVGWYPQSAEKIARFLDTVPKNPPPQAALAAVAPHAGWFYSGSIAAAAVSVLDPRSDTVVLIGGHLPAGMPPLFAEEARVSTPLGDVEIDGEFRDILQKELEDDVFPQGIAVDRYQDNTIEVLLPMVRYFIPHARLLWLRLPAETASFEAGKRIARIGETLGRNLGVLGSTDLTHYGDNYNFSPMGSGKQALDWVRAVNDRTFIQVVKEGNPAKVLAKARQDKSSCSAGAVLGAMGFAQSRGAGNATLLAYGTSVDAGNEDGEIPNSFVGYAALAWYPIAPGC
ncbi:MAG: AmmeMemoRadiSam system protein B [Treponema sp.]|jgi:AmmeMemoRadiSam system protein B|nr:AmmeMemoRadiSam system protein B [Treponema sp.]